MLVKYFIALLGFFSPCYSFACSCPHDSIAFNTKAAFKSADMVFLGTVTHVAEIKRGKETFRQASFEVQESFKGVTGKNIKLETELHMCGSHFTKGQKYLQYGYKDPKKNNVCNGTSVAASADQSIKKLRFLTSEQEIKTKSACDEKNGKWMGQFKIDNGLRCFLPTPDKGMICKDLDECISICFAEIPIEKFEKKGKCLGKFEGKACKSIHECGDEVCEIFFEPIQGSGHCYGWTRLSGTCLSHVKAGWIHSPLCID